MEEKSPVIRYSSPTRLDLAPFGTICKVIDCSDTQKFFIQLNKEPENASWQPISHLLETIFSDQILNPEFIQICLDLYANKNQESFKKISTIISQ